MAFTKLYLNCNYFVVGDNVILKRWGHGVPKSKPGPQNFEEVCNDMEKVPIDKFHKTHQCVNPVPCPPLV